LANPVFRGLIKISGREELICNEHPSGAEASLNSRAFAARLKSGPATKRLKEPEIEFFRSLWRPAFIPGACGATEVVP
jgi:hypothetical protein